MYIEKINIATRRKQHRISVPVCSTQKLCCTENLKAADLEARGESGIATQHT